MLHCRVASKEVLYLLVPSKKNGPLGSAKSHMKRFLYHNEKFLANSHFNFNYPVAIHLCYLTKRSVLSERGTTVSADHLGEAFLQMMKRSRTLHFVEG